MDALRRLHNQKKRELIMKYVSAGDNVLDCGCGRGGDWHKWKTVGARVTAVDPDESALEEARERALGLNFPVRILQGDIFSALVYGPYFDVVCYNFSIQYILDNLASSVEAIAQCVRPGGRLIGITPDGDRIRQFKSPDTLGNDVTLVDDQHVSVRLVDGPFYASGPRIEPMIDRRLLESALRPWFNLVSWRPMLDRPSGFISDIYSTFIFVRKYNNETR